MSFAVTVNRVGTLCKILRCVSSIFVGWLGDACEVHVDARPVIIRLFDGNVCAASDRSRCDEVHIIAERFAVNPLFSCKVQVSQVSLRYLLLL